MDPLPTGTLTLLFSDIEGSTALLRRLGEDYPTVLSAQRSLLRSAFAQWQGREMGTEGDSFFVVFTSAGDALHAALDGQRALSAHEWPAAAQVRVRMGVHTGEPGRHEDGYVGLDVHVAARVASAAHGGQVLFTEATERIASAHLSPGASTLDLGWHRLKDLPSPLHLYQLAAEGLDRDFPPVRSLGGRTRLPVLPTSTVGREGELRELRELLVGGTRLVTLTGPGGSGKTRLAVSVAEATSYDFPDGVYFVPLESVTSADIMWTTLADALGVTGDERTPEALVDHVSMGQSLLVLDNLEQLDAAAKVVHELLAAPRLAIVATSRRPLHLYGEVEHPVPPLTLPPVGASGADELARSGAVQLFVQRAQLVRPDFRLDEQNAGDVAEICRLLDGLPLAIELAAARVKLLGASALRARLSGDLELLAVRQPDRPARQQTLRATVTWSYELLPSELQSYLRRLGAFAGDFDLDAATAVAGDGVEALDAIGELADVSLVSVQDGSDGEPRVHLLRTIAAFARRWLDDTGELDPVLRRHAEYYAALVQRVAPQLRGSYVISRDRIEAEMDNIRAALAWALPYEPGPPERAAVGLALATGMSWFWYASGYRYQAEARRWLSRAIERAAGREGPELMTSLHGLAVLLLQHGEDEAARDALLRCLAYWRRDGDPHRIAKELSSLGAAHRALGERAAARAVLEESIELARATGDRERLPAPLTNLALVDLDEDRCDEARARLQEAIVLDEELGDVWGLAADRMNMVGVLLHDGRTEEAHRALRASARSAVELGDVELTINVIELFAMVHAAEGDARRAAHLLGASEDIRRRAELPIDRPDAEWLERGMERVRPADGTAWEDAVRAGRRYTLEEALEEAEETGAQGAAATTPPLH